MAVKTFPSKAMTLIDLPEVGDCSVEFIYNYWISGETDDESGEYSAYEFDAFSDPDGLVDIQAEENLDAPRYVTLTFVEPEETVGKTPEEAIEDSMGAGFWEEGGGATSIVDEDAYGTLSTFFADITTDLEAEYTRGNIMREESITNSVFSGISLQPTTLVSSLYTLFSGSLEAISSLSDEDTLIDTDIGSRQDQAKSFIDSFESGGITTESKSLLIKTLSSYQTEGYSGALEEDLLPNSFNNIASHMSMNCSLNSLVMGDIIDKASEAGGNFFFNECRTAHSQANTIQNTLIANTSAGVINISGYVPAVASTTCQYIQAVTDGATDFNDYSDENAQVVGYMIEKRRLDASGNVTNLDPIFLTGKLNTTVIDYAVAYGFRYQYKVRAIYLARFAAVNVTDDSGYEYAFAGVLIASRGTSYQTAYCVENAPPPAPCDFYFEIDDDNESLTIAWSFPLNMQRDIMKFQTFKRASTEDPFMLIGQINFSEDSSVDVTYETIPSSLDEQVDGPRCYFVDTEWSRDSSFIYAVCSIDAHGISSGYSTQYEVSYDYFSGGLVVDRVSKNGAPKPYPNIFLEGDTFQDTIKDSNHSKFYLYFDPEYLRVTSEDGTDLNILDPELTAAYETVGDIDTESHSPAYKMQIINVDLQKSVIFNIYLADSDSVLTLI